MWARLTTVLDADWLGLRLWTWCTHAELPFLKEPVIVSFSVSVDACLDQLLFGICAEKKTILGHLFKERLFITPDE